MNNKSVDIREQYYLPEQLKKQLSKILHYPLTIVEAPSGFGKTTAIHEYMKVNLPSDAHEYWYTCLGDPTVKMWNGICRLLGYADSEIADQLMKLEFPTTDSISEIAELIREIRCDITMYLIIDNYQILDSVAPKELLSAFAMQGRGSKLHLIFITQQLNLQQQTSLRHSLAHIIPASDFFFDKSSTIRLLKLAGIRLTEEELESIHTTTEGWVSALRLQIINYQKNNCFEYNVDIEHLVEAAIWTKLSSEEKDFLLAVSVLDSFTIRQARRILGGKCLPESIETLLASNALIRFYPENDAYIIHSILQGYLRKRFYQYQSENFQNQRLSMAGHSCVDMSDYSSAARFYSKADDFDSFLSLPLRKDYLSCTSDWFLIDLIVRTLRICPPETLRRYPESALIFAFQLFLFNQYEVFAYLCKIVSSALEQPINLDEKEQIRLRGEMQYLLSFTEYNNIEKMIERHKAAHTLLGGPSRYRFILGNFGSVSVVYMYWSKAGELEREITLMEQNLPRFRILSGGHSTGSDSVMRAEWLLMQGEVDDAEILCHKTIYLAKAEKQICICLCAELVLARIAILRGDSEAYRTATENIQQYAKGRFGRYTERAAQLCQGFLNLTLGEIHKLAEWLCDLKEITNNLYPATVPYGQMLYGKFLLLKQRYSELYGISQPILELAKENNYLLPQVYHLLYLAVAKQNSGRQAEAQVLFNQALELALPDKVYLPFAEHSSLLPLMKTARYSGFDKMQIDDILSLYDRQQSGVKKVIKVVMAAESPLTPREREVARLARERLSTKEIAGKLFVSEGTIKSTLKNIYRKLEIESKTQLKDKIV